MNKQLATNVFELVQVNENLFQTANTTSLVEWQKESQFAIQHLQKNDRLKDTAFKNPASIQNAIINVAAVGISLNPANKHAYLVPRDGAVYLDVSYMGLIHIAVRSGAIEWAQAKIVYENDEYTNNGIDQKPTHKQKTFGDKGKPVGVYCCAKLSNGDFLTEEMDAAQIEKVRQTSKSKDSKYSPWQTFPDEMWRKTVVKRAAKYWITGTGEPIEQLNEAINVINEHEGLADIYSPAEKKELDRLIDCEAAFSLYAFFCRFDEEKQTALFNSFEKGTITANKKAISSLTKKGYEEFQNLVYQLQDYIARDDDLSIQSETEGFTDYEIEMLSRFLSPEDFSKCEALING
jgi:recombination protein RecT